MSGENYILCVQCRGTFSDADVASGWGCPRCGNQGVPADTRRTGTVTLTEHEWRILCMWAENWATRVCAKEDRPGSSSPATIGAIVREIHRQAPTLGSLSFGEEIQDVANQFGKLDVITDGHKKTFTPETKQ